MIDFSYDWFFGLDAALRAAGHDSDDQSFDEILQNLGNRKIYKPDEFASLCAYVILAGGFSQKTAKKIHRQIMDFLNKFFNHKIELLEEEPSDILGFYDRFFAKNKLKAKKIIVISNELISDEFKEDNFDFQCDEIISA